MVKLIKTMPAKLLHVSIVISMVTLAVPHVESYARFCMCLLGLR